MTKICIQNRNPGLKTAVWKLNTCTFAIQPFKPDHQVPSATPVAQVVDGDAVVCCGYRAPHRESPYSSLAGYKRKHRLIFCSRARAKMSAVQKLSRFQVRFLQHARRRRRLCNLACPRVPVPSSCRSLSGAFGTQAPASGAKTWNESRWVCQRIDYDKNMVRVAVPR